MPRLTEPLARAPGSSTSASRQQLLNHTQPTLTYTEQPLYITQRLTSQPYRLFATVAKWQVIAMPVKGKPNRVTKTCRPNQKTAILPGSAEEQAALFAEHANGTSRTRSHQSSQNSYINPSHSSSSSMEANLHFPSASILDGSQNGSDTKQMSFYSDVDAEGDEELVSVNPLTGLARTAEDVVFDVYGDIIKIDSALCKKLAREAAIRPPTQRRTEQKLNMERRSNVEALLAHITGEPSPQPCKNCHKGHGPWTECIIYDGQMCGSCTNCWFNASGSRCTYHGTFELLYKLA